MEDITSLMNNPNSLPEICSFVANGGSLTTLCKEKGILYNQVVNWIYDDPEKQRQYENALNARGEWVAQSVLEELKKVSFIDIRKLFNDDGSVKDVSQLDDDTAAAIGGIDIQEAKYDKDGNETEPRTRKIKLVDKLNAIKLLGANLRMFTEKVEHTHVMKLEELVGGSMPEEGEENAEAKEEEAVKEEDQTETDF